MHHALAIPEIVRMILDCFLAGPIEINVNKVNYRAATALRSSVLNVALTCRSFSEPALDILWWAMDDLVPLFNLLPGFQNKQGIHFPVSEHTREVFDRFARRIRFLCMINTAEDRVNIASYVKVLQTLGRFHLLPRLQFIYTERNEPQLLFLGSPHLRTFRTSRNITGGVDADYVQSFLDLLPSTSPKTTNLHVEFPLQERCLDAIGRMPQLRFLIMFIEDTSNRLSLGSDFITNFASRQTLTSWHLQGNISVAPPPASGFPIVDFGSLVYLSLASKKETSIVEYTSLFRVGNFQSLQKIVIRLIVNDTPGQYPSPTKLWRNFFQCLRSATPLSLSTIEVKIAGPTASQVSFEDLPDLQTFILFTFKTNLFHSLSAANLSMMFACWPNINCLQISGVDQVTIGFSSLVEIAIQLPYLEDLEIQINCTTFPTITDVPILEHDLETLKLSPLHLENHIVLARCIDRIFPELLMLNIAGSPPVLKSGVGKEIQEIYEGLQSARMDQRERDNVSIPT